MTGQFEGMNDQYSMSGEDDSQQGTQGLPRAEVRDAGVIPTPVPRCTEGTEETPMPRSGEGLIRALEDVMMEINKGMQQLRRFESAHPYLIAPNIYRCWEEGLKETSMMMSREFHRLREQRDRGELDDLLSGTE